MLKPRYFPSRFISDTNGVSMLTECDARILQRYLTRESHAPAKQKLLGEMRHEPARRLGVVLKCGACLMILAGLVLIGATTDLQSPAPSGTVAAGASAQDRERGLVVDAEQTSGERTGRFNEQPIAFQSDGNATQMENAQAQKAGTERATVSAEHHRKAVFDERRRAWEQRRYGEDKRIAARKDEP